MKPPMVGCDLPQKTIATSTSQSSGAVPGESEEKVFEFDRCVRQRPQRFPSSSLRSSVGGATPKQDPFSGDVFFDSSRAQHQNQP